MRFKVIKFILTLVSVTYFGLPAHSSPVTSFLDLGHTCVDFLSGTYVGSADRYARYGRQALSPLGSRPLQVLARDLYGDFRAEMILSRLNRLHPSFKELVTDPGLVHRLDQFYSFVKERPELTDPWQAREAFSNHLGSDTFYRALRLSSHEYRRILAQGLTAKRLPRDERLIGKFNLFEMVKEHVKNPGSGEKDYVLSITKDWRIAAAVAGRFSPRKTVYMFEIKVPVLDTFFIDPSGTLFGMSDPNLKIDSALRVKTSDGKIDKIPYSKDVESFMLYKIDREEIVRSYPIAENELPIYTLRDPDLPQGLMDLMSKEPNF